MKSFFIKVDCMGYFIDVLNLCFLNYVSISMKSIRIRRIFEVVFIMVYKLEFLVIFLLLVFVNFVIVVKKEMIKFKKKKIRLYM